MAGLPSNQIRAFAKILYHVPVEDRQETFNAAAEELGLNPNQWDNDFARVEQNYPPERCKELVEKRKPPPQIRHSAFCCGSEAQGMVAPFHWGK